MNLFSISIILLFATLFTTQDDPPTFGSKAILGVVVNAKIDEASGLVASANNRGVLWTHNDKGNKNRIFALDTNGNNLGEFYLDGIENRDWEDIAIGPGPVDGLTYLYIGDIGDNDKQYSSKFIYRIEEPTVNVGQSFVDSIITDVSTITLVYPDENRDAETLMIDPLTKDLFILSKRNTNIRLYKAMYPQSTSEIINMELEVKLNFPKDPEENEPFNYVTAGEISSDGTEIIVKTYEDIYYWSRNENESIAQAMSKVPVGLPYDKEPQGEAICWKPYDDKGYYTLSEEKITVDSIEYVFPAILYYYPRTSLVSVEQNANIPNVFSLEQNYPNPFNPTTTIEFTIPVIDTKFASTTNAVLTVYDLQGKEVAILVDENKSAGKYSVSFNAVNLPSGVYYYQLKVGSYSETKKMILLK
ncbi:MAG: T9SS type A sorting domain-containing protein [Ignavibacteriae bacterium]|nr:T9SS type A sorting domain-containing protein [Ignavibacteriota bacterium]